MRARLDWKYVLRLVVDDAGFDPSVLSEFRSWPAAGAAQGPLLETLLGW